MIIGTVELDNIDTWGDNIKEKILHLNELEKEFEEKKSKKTNPIELNQEWMSVVRKYVEKKEKIQNQIIEELSERKIVCYHCTRLTQAEYYSVKEKGLVVLVKEMQIERIRKLGLDKDEETRLIEDIRMKDLSSRKNQIHFIYSLSSIDTGCIPFLENWGGESICYNIKKFENIKEKIVNISKPYIIKFEIKYSDICANFFIENMKKELKYGKINRRRIYK